MSKIYQIKTMVGTVFVSEPVADIICKCYKLESIFNLYLENDTTVIDVEEHWLMEEEQKNDALFLIEQSVKKRQELCDHKGGLEKISGYPASVILGKIPGRALCIRDSGRAGKAVDRATRAEGDLGPEPGRP